MTDKRIGRKIKQIQRNLGVTQAQFAALYNATPPFNLTVRRVDISRYISGTNDLPTSKYLKFLDMDPCSVRPKQPIL